MVRGAQQQRITGAPTSRMNNNMVVGRQQQPQNQPMSAPQPVYIVPQMPGVIPYNGYTQGFKGHYNTVRIHFKNQILKPTKFLPINFFDVYFFFYRMLLRRIIINHHFIMPCKCNHSKGLAQQLHSTCHQ